MTISTALLFPGQGSQEPNMGRDVAEHSPEAMALWKKAERISGLPLRSIYWESNDANLMADTRNLQPALTVANLNLWQTLAPHLAEMTCLVNEVQEDAQKQDKTQEQNSNTLPNGPGTQTATRRVRVSCTAGHSLGEYSALAAAGVLSLESVLELVSLRGALMADADPDAQGAMAAVLKLDRLSVEALVAEAAAHSGEMLLVANYNTPAQFVISGVRAAVETALSMVKERKGRAVPLPVSGAFHSPLMARAAKELAIALDKATWSKPRFPVYANVTSHPITDGESLRELGKRQMTSSVLWIDTIEQQWRQGVRAWLEVGPKGVLSRMIKPILHSVPSDPVILGAGSLEALELLIHKN